MMSVENLKCSKKKKKPSEGQGEKYIKPIFTAKERKKGENILQADNEVTSKEGNWKKRNTIL